MYDESGIVAMILLLVCVGLSPCNCIAENTPPDMVGLEVQPGNGGLVLPVPADEIEEGEVVYMDHDSNDSILACTDFAGQTDCYSGHIGTDYLLAGEWEAMDRGVPVFAAAAGRVAIVDDGHYDRCHADLLAADWVSCDGHEEVSNMVALVHEDGLSTSYLHLRKGSIRVAEGQEVACGEQIAEVGSSGRSAVPHLHFELREAGVFTDPYQGPWSQPWSFWREQDRKRLPGEQCE